MVAEVPDVTVTVFMVKLAEFFPAATVTFAGTLALVGLLLESVTTMPPVGAGPVRLTVPVDGEPRQELPTDLKSGTRA